MMFGIHIKQREICFKYHQFKFINSDIKLNDFEYRIFHEATKTKIVIQNLAWIITYTHSWPIVLIEFL